MFINKNLKYWINRTSVFTELLCDGGYNDKGEVVEEDGSNKDVSLDNANAGDGENKVNLVDVYDGGGDSNNDVGVDDIGRVSTVGGDEADFGNGDTKFYCGTDRGGGDGDNKDDGGVDDDGDTDSGVDNGANCDDGRGKGDCSKGIAVDDGTSKSDGGGDTNDNGKDGDGSDSESNDGTDGHKNDGVIMTMDVWILLKTALKINSFRKFLITRLR